ncbi:MAG: TIR domain-containing protein [Candidatus Marinimicrobia bacterium]|nr:TIR domain-containing protein [Candidatus Neomarinimicrobiota bacterium]
MYKYDFAISFAGEERKIAESLALKLIEKGIRVFYDNFELHKLWGEDLAEKLYRIYSEESKYCIILVSEKYLEKMWTTHERKSALQKQITQKGRYILPIRIDEVSLPGLPDTIGYINFKEHTIVQIVELAQLKLGLPGSDTKEIVTNPKTIEREEIIELTDPRLDRHQSFSNSLFIDQDTRPFYQLQSLSKTVVSINDDTFKETFINPERRYSESLFYSQSPITHFEGYTKKLVYPNPDRLIDAVTCYYDGHVVTEGYFEENVLNPNFFIYAIQRHLQLSKEILEQYVSEINFLIRFNNLNNIKWQIYRGNHFSKSLDYCGYHKEIIIPIQMNEIHGRDKWNKKMAVAELALIRIARIFGLDHLPQSYWDNEELLVYAKIGER